MRTNIVFHLCAAMTVLATVSYTVSAQQAQGVTPQQLAVVRASIAEGNRVWGKARVAGDRATFERMMLPNAFVQVYDQRITRQEFIDQISAPANGAPSTQKMTRFDATVLTIRPDSVAGQWVATIEEKIEVEGFTPDKKPAKAYSLWITRDVWKQVDQEWRVVSSTAIGHENWLNQVPPIVGW